MEINHLVILVSKNCDIIYEFVLWDFRSQEEIGELLRRVKMIFPSSNIARRSKSQTSNGRCYNKFVERMWHDLIQTG